MHWPVGVLACLLAATLAHGHLLDSGETGNKTTYHKADGNALQVFGPALKPRDYGNRRNNRDSLYGKKNTTGPVKKGKDYAQSPKVDPNPPNDKPTSNTIQHIDQAHGNAHDGHGHAHDGHGHAHNDHGHAHHPHDHAHHDHGHAHHGHDHAHHGHGHAHHGHDHAHHHHGNGHHGHGKRRGRFHVCKTKDADGTEKTTEGVDCINDCKLIPDLHQPLNGTKVSTCRAKRRPSNYTTKPNRYLHKWPVICDVTFNGTRPEQFKPRPSCSSGQTCKAAPHQPLAARGVSISICYYGSTIVYHQHEGRCHRFRRYKFNRRGRGKGRGRYRFRCPGGGKKRKGGRIKKRRCPAFWSVMCVRRLIRNH